MKSDPVFQAGERKQAVARRGVLNHFPIFKKRHQYTPASSSKTSKCSPKFVEPGVSQALNLSSLEFVNQASRPELLLKSRRHVVFRLFPKGKDGCKR